MIELNRRSVLVTGTSTGIGRAVALALAKLGWRVYAGVRRSEDGDRLIESAADNLKPVILDVTKPEQIQDVARLLRGELDESGLHGLVNNAGINVSGPIEFLPPDDLRRQFEVNVIGQVAVTQAFLPLLRRVRGRVVNIGSVSGWSAMPLIGPYCASKFALRALSDTLRLELRPWGIRVILIDPGPISTMIWEKAMRRKNELPDKARELYGPMIERALDFTARSVSQAIPPERVADKVINALTNRRPKPRYFVGASIQSGLLLEKLPVRLRDWLIARFLLSDYPKPKSR
ncbi:SDR family oxidoreductase [bacterium]|nr:SDR family oxidoreductase [bacterium]